MTPRLKKSVAGEARCPTWQHGDDANYGDDNYGNFGDGDGEHGDEANDGHDDLPDGTGNVQLQEP